MAEEIPSSVEVFLGLITKEGRVRYQRHGKEEFFRLPGGKTKGDLAEILHPEKILLEAIRKTKEDFNIIVHEFPVSCLYRTVVHHKNIQWKFVIPVIPDYWIDECGPETEIWFAEPDDLEGLNRVGSIASDMQRMGWACFWLYDLLYPESPWGVRAAELLCQKKPYWAEEELSKDPYFCLARIRESLIL